MNLDDLFGDSFGSHDSFFHSGHFRQHQQHHIKHNQRAHRNHQHMHNIVFDDFSSFQQEQNCKTVTQRVGNMVTQYTTCS